MHDGWGFPRAPGLRQLQFSVVAIRPMHSLTGSEHPSRSSEAKLFGIEFSYLHVSKEDSIKPRRDQLYSQLFEAEYFTDEDSVLVPANVAAIVDSSQLEPFGYLDKKAVTDWTAPHESGHDRRPNE